MNNTKVDFEPNVIEDRELITGQIESDHLIGAKLVQALQRVAAPV